jgi:hypothetical protein
MPFAMIQERGGREAYEGDAAGERPRAWLGWPAPNRGLKSRSGSDSRTGRPGPVAGIDLIIMERSASPSPSPRRALSFCYTRPTRTVSLSIYGPDEWKTKLWPGSIKAHVEIKDSLGDNGIVLWESLTERPPPNGRQLPVNCVFQRATDRRIDGSTDSDTDSVTRSIVRVLRLHKALLEETRSLLELGSWNGNVRAPFAFGSAKHFFPVCLREACL